MIQFLYTLFALMAIIVGLVTIIKVVHIAEIIVGLFSLTFGITAIIWAVRARNSLSVGSELRKYANFFLVSLMSVIAFSFFDLMLSIFKYNEFSVYFYYPKYAFLTATYFIFLGSSYQILSIGRMFGFNKAADSIKKVMKEKKKSKV